MTTRKTKAKPFTSRKELKPARLRSAKLPKVNWEAHAQLGLSVIFGKKKLVSLLSKNPLTGDYAVIAVETEGKGIKGVLDKHAHQIVGVSPTIRAAMTLAEEFAVQWVEKQGAGIPVELCHCKSIGISK